MFIPSSLKAWVNSPTFVRFNSPATCDCEGEDEEASVSYVYFNSKKDMVVPTPMASRITVVVEDGELEEDEMTIPSKQVQIPFPVGIFINVVP